MEWDMHDDKRHTRSGKMFKQSIFVFCMMLAYLTLTMLAYLTHTITS